MCSHKLTAGTHHSCYSEVAPSLIPSLFSHRPLSAAVVSSEALVREEPGPGADSPLRGIPLWSVLLLPCRLGGGWGVGEAVGCSSALLWKGQFWAGHRRLLSSTRALERRGSMVTREVLPPRVEHHCPQGDVQAVPGSVP